MPTKTFAPDEALEQYDGVSDSNSRSAYVANHSVVPLKIETQHADAWDYFNDLNSDVLPRLPHGYRWVEVENQYAVMRADDTAIHQLNLIIYGPDAKKQINYLFQVDGVTTFGFAHTRTTKDPSRSYPMTQDHYRVPGYDYSVRKYSAHVRGHIIDHKDTIQEVAPRSAWSTYDGRNYVPEPPDYHWGLGVRKQKVAEIRKRGAAYSQFMHYAEGCDVTLDRTPVPTAIYFASYSCVRGRYTLKDVLNPEFEEDLSRARGVKYLEHAKANLAASPEVMPVAVPYSPSSTDRKLRLLKLNSVRKSDAIASGAINSRFPERDGIYAQTDAADIEVGSVSRRLTAANFINGAGDDELGLAYVKRAINFGETQLDFDTDVPIFDINAHKAGSAFFKTYSGDKDVDELEDHFRQLGKDQPGRR